MKEKRSFALLFFIFMRMVFPIAELLPVWEYIFAVYDKASPVLHLMPKQYEMFDVFCICQTSHFL